MKKRILLLTALFSLLALLLTACGGETSDEAPTDAPTGAAEVTDAPTEAPTEEPTEAPTEAPTEEPTEAPTEAEVPTEEATKSEEELEDPYLTPIRVGTSYDGKTPAYDGHLYHPFELFDATDSTGLTGSFDSIQDAMDFLEGIGGNIMLQNYGDVGICLSVHVPEDECFYRLAYNWNNCDFIFNYGYTYDDGSGGYAYYSLLDELDIIAGLDNTHVYVWGHNDEFPEGYYLMTWVGDFNGQTGRNYNYEKVAEVQDVWPGLQDGETFFD